MPGYTAAQAVHTLATLRADTARLWALDPAATAPAAFAAAVAAGALRAALVLSGRTTYDAVRDDLSYTAYDMTRRLRLLAESVAEPRTWPGAASRAMWTAEVADWSGFEVSSDRVGGLAALAPLLGDLRELAPLPGTDPAPAALGLVEPVMVTVVQRAVRWAVVVAVVLLRPRTDPAALDAELPLGTGLRVASSRPARSTLRGLDPLLMQHYDALVEVEVAIASEVAPSKRSGGHMDVRPDEAVVDGLRWRAASAVAAVTLLGRRHLIDQDGPLAFLAGHAYDLIAAVSAAATFPDDGVRSLRQAAELALVLTASCQR